MIELVLGEALQQAIIRVEKNVARLFVLDLVKIELEGRHAAPDADIEPAMAQMVEYRQLLEQPQRRVKREQEHQRTEANLLGRARHRAEIGPRMRDHIERRSMMLGHLIGVNSGLIRRRDELQAL